MRFLLCLALLGAASTAAALEPKDVFVVANKNVPASREVAEHYLAKRGVPKANLVELDLPAEEKAELAKLQPELEAAKKKADELRKGKGDLAELLAAARRANELESRRIVLSYQESVAGVDSELMLLWWPNYPLARWVMNPL